MRELRLSGHFTARALAGDPTPPNNLGPALRYRRRFEEAVSAHQDAAAIFREAGDQHWDDIALGNLERYRAAQATTSEIRQQASSRSTDTGY